MYRCLPTDTNIYLTDIYIYIYIPLIVICPCKTSVKCYNKYLRVRNTNVAYELLQEYSTRCFLSQYKIASNTNKLLTVIRFGWAVCFIHVGFIPTLVGCLFRPRWVHSHFGVACFAYFEFIPIVSLCQSAKLFFEYLFQFSGRPTVRSTAS